MKKAWPILFLPALLTLEKGRDEYHYDQQIGAGLVVFSIIMIAIVFAWGMIYGE